MRRIACLLPVLTALACHAGGPQGASSFGTLPLTIGSGEGSTGSGEGSTGGSTTAVPEDSTAGGSSGAAASGGTTLVLDVGTPDAGVPGPEGCQGKIDFLFVISSHLNQQTVMDKLVAAFPQFIATIESRFADFDYHIMVVDSDPDWGSGTCNEDCTPEGCDIPDYPCDMIDTLTACDWTLGAGTVFNAGESTFNAPCAIGGNRRYLVKGQPDLPETFQCLAQVGLHGHSMIGGALAAAVTPAKTGKCNQGFLRDDALLFVALLHAGTDYLSAGTPKEWAQAVLDAKHGDVDAVVMLDVGPISSVWWTDLESCADDKQGALCRMLKFFPHRLWKDALLADYAAVFDEAVDLIDTVCASFVPR